LSIKATDSTVPRAVSEGKGRDIGERFTLVIRDYITGFTISLLKNGERGMNRTFHLLMKERVRAVLS
jgi:hypothetical protein